MQNIIIMNNQSFQKLKPNLAKEKSVVKAGLWVKHFIYLSHQCIEPHVIYFEY